VSFPVDSESCGTDRFVSDEMGNFYCWKHTETFLEQIFLAINNYHSIFAQEQVTNYPDEQRYGTEPRTDTEQGLALRYPMAKAWNTLY